MFQAVSGISGPRVSGQSRLAPSDSPLDTEPDIFSNKHHITTQRNKFALEHDDTATPAASLAHLGIAVGDLLHYTDVKRSYGARQHTAMELIYSLHIEVRHGAAYLRACSTISI